MKKWIGILLVFSAVVAMGSCTNDEDGTGIDLISPNDSTTAETAK